MNNVYPCMCDTRLVAVWRPTPLRPARSREPPGLLRTRSTLDTKSHTSQNRRRSSSLLSRLYRTTPLTKEREEHKQVRRCTTDVTFCYCTVCKHICMCAYSISNKPDHTNNMPDSSSSLCTFCITCFRSAECRRPSCLP